MTKKLKGRLQHAHTKVCLNYHGLICQLETYMGFALASEKTKLFPFV